MADVLARALGGSDAARPSWLSMARTVALEELSASDLCSHRGIRDGRELEGLGMTLPSLGPVCS